MSDASRLDVPTIETARLSLRGHRVSDFDDCAAMWGHEDVTRFIGGKPSTREEVWSRILRYAGHWALLGFGYWVVTEKTTGKYVGEVGFADFQRELTPSFDGAPEAGWVLAPSAHGKGYATESMGAALAWADRHWDKGRTACMIAPGNSASIRVAAKCGFVELARADYKGSPTLLFERPGRTV